MHLADQARNTFRTDFTRHERPAMNNNGSHGYRATRLCGKRDHAELPAPHDYSRATVVVDGSRSAERAKATSDASARSSALAIEAVSSRISARLNGVGVHKVVAVDNLSRREVCKGIVWSDRLPEIRI